VELQHIYVLDELPLHHNDPFDRLLIAQAKAEQAWLVSGDSRFQLYPVDVIW
jgi:PIN domain nuclease of toxin-antitoxin system